MDEALVILGNGRSLAPAVQAVLQADEARYCAMLAGDLATLERLLSDGLSYTHSSALCENKQEYLDSLARGRFKYLRVECGEVGVDVHGDIALVRGKVLIHALVDGAQRALNNRFLSVWKCSASGWQMLAWASTPIPTHA